MMTANLNMLFGLPTVLSGHPFYPAQALQEASVLGLETYFVRDAVIDIDAEAGNAFAQNLAEYKAAKENQTEDAARMAQNRLSEIIGGLPQEKWAAARKKVESAGLAVGGWFATPPALRTMLEIQRFNKIDVGRGQKFDFETLTPAVVHLMYSEEKVEAAKQYLGEVEERTRNTLAKIRELESNDLHGLQQIRDEYKREARRLEGLQPKSLNNPGLQNWVGALFSSGSGLYISLLSKLDTALLQLKNGSPPLWHEALRPIHRFSVRYRQHVVGQHGYRIRRVQKELATRVIQWFERNFPRRTWENGRLKLTNDTGRLFQGNHHFLPAWPPSNRDRVLKRYLDQLGWKMKVETHPHGKDYETIVTLDFGKTSLLVHDPDGWMRRKNGNFEVSAMRPAEVAMLPDSEKLALAVQLFRELILLSLPTSLFV